MTAHTAAQPAIRALSDLANWQPANAHELGRMLEALHAYGQDSIIAALLTLLDNLAAAGFGLPGVTPEQSRLIAGPLRAAGEHISAAACDYLDRAREATGTEWPR